MAFHFPLMPRVFLALNREDARPIADLVRETYFLPPTCQWALFLRNHNELSIAALSDDERQAMLQGYAPEPRMRLHLGIRRRLAPLLANHRGRIELALSLLFSLPGSPVIYYGDELGMGDNIWLRDRDGVRTPMQWSAGRHAGFSQGDSLLTAPIVDDSTYGYQRLNVEAQERDAGSLLCRVRHLLRVRRASRAFGRGAIEFLSTGNEHVLAFLRRYDGEALLVVANLAGTEQEASARLPGETVGHEVSDLVGRSCWPQVGLDPYAFALGPSSFYWLRLSAGPADAPVHLC